MFRLWPPLVAGTMTTEAPTFTTVEAAQRAGVTVKQLRGWYADGYLRPTLTRGGRIGRALRWDQVDIDSAAVLGAVTDALYLGPTPNNRASIMRLFACALAIRKGAPVGVIQEVGDYEVTIEVRHV
jgi:hypothetical protein